MRNQERKERGLPLIEVNVDRPFDAQAEARQEQLRIAVFGKTWTANSPQDRHRPKRIKTDNGGFLRVTEEQVLVVRVAEKEVVLEFISF